MEIHYMDVNYNNKIQEIFIKNIPYFKGNWIVFTNLLKLLPEKFRQCVINENNLKLDLSDPAQFSIVNHRKGTHELGLVNFIQKNLKTNGTFIDIGANFGYFSYIASKTVGEHGLILSFEPAQSAFKQLNNTIKRNKLFNIIPFNIALGDEKTSVRMNKSWLRQNTSSHMDNGNSLLSNTLDNLITNLSLNRKIDMIKIDVEGHEVEVLAGAREIFF